MRIFAGEWVKTSSPPGNAGRRSHRKQDGFRRIEGAQKKREEQNFEVRKNLLEYDEVMDEQRKRVYTYRQNILEGANCKKLVLAMIDRQLDHYLGEFLAKDYGTETFAGWAGKELSVELEARDYRGVDFETAEQYAMDEAEKMAEGQVLDLIDENMPEDVDPGEWNWQALAKTLNTRWQLSVRDRELKKIGRDNLDEFLIEKSRVAVQKVDLSEGEMFLKPDFGVRNVIGWMRHKFDITLDFDEVANSN